MGMSMSARTEAARPTFAGAAATARGFCSRESVSASSSRRDASSARPSPSMILLASASPSIASRA